MVDSIQSLNAYGTDPYFMQALGSFNPNFRGANQVPQMSQAAQLAQAQAAAQVPETTSTSNVGIDPSFKANPETEEKSSHKGLITAGIVLTGATAILAYSRGKKAGFKGWNAITNGVKSFFKSSKASKEATSAATEVSNLIKNGGDKLKEYTIKQGGASYTVKNGNITKIIPHNKQVINDPSKIAEWLKGHKSIETQIHHLNLGGELPKGVKLSYTKVIGNGKNAYQMVVENGQVIKAASKDKAGKWIDVADDQLASFIKNHGKEVKEATTLTKTLAKQNVRLLDSSNKLVSQNGKLQLSVRNGEVVGATFNGNPITNKTELAALRKDYAKEIQKFGRENGAIYGLNHNEYSYIYRQKGGQTFRFNNTRKITSVTDFNQTALTTQKAIDDYLAKNPEVNTALNGIISNGAIPESYRFGTGILENNGLKFNVTNNGINSVISNQDFVFGGKTIKAGKAISGEALKAWKNVAENNNEWTQAMALLV